VKAGPPNEVIKGSDSWRLFCLRAKKYLGRAIILDRFRDQLSAAGGAAATRRLAFTTNYKSL